MFARTTTLAARQPGIDRGVRYVRDDVLPALEEIHGFVGISTLVDEATGRCVIATSWHSAAALRDAEPTVRRILDRCIVAFDGQDSTVDDWEVALMHRVHTSENAAGAQVSWIEGDPDTMSETIDAFRAATIDLERLPGFASASLFIDRPGGRAVLTVVYDSAAAMAKARAKASEIRTSVADVTGTYVIEVAEFALPISQLRIPELV